MTSFLDGDALLFSTYRKSAKIARLRRDPRVSVLVVRYRDSRPSGALLVHGNAEITDGVLDVEHTKGLNDVAERVSAAVIATAARNHNSGKRCLVRVTVVSMGERR